MKKDIAITGISVSIIFSIIQFGIGFFDKRNDKSNERLSKIEITLNEIKMQSKILDEENRAQQDFIDRNRGKIDKIMQYTIENHIEIKNIKENINNVRYERKK